MGPQGPIVNGVPIDGGAPRVITPPKESHVLNDAIVAAALDLRKRDRTRRKVIFIISDGREYGSNASYSDTLKVLLSNGIQVYGVAVEGSAIPGYGSLQKLHVPAHRLATGLQQHPAQVCQCHRRRDFLRVFPRRHRDDLRPRPGRRPQSVHPGISDPRHSQQHAPRDRGAGGASRPDGDGKRRLLSGRIGALKDDCRFQIVDFRLKSFRPCGFHSAPLRSRALTANDARPLQSSQ